jgi:DNA mismatch repair ATPase MutS
VNGDTWLLTRGRHEGSGTEQCDWIEVVTSGACVQRGTFTFGPVDLQLMVRDRVAITGPNGGGKSSFMRAVLQAVLFGHSYGYAPATATMPRLKWIASGLQLRDSPGVLSMFETEVKFAATALAAGAGPGLVLFDELFHSTNAPDGTRTATLFLEQLWSRTNVYSVVSTHIFPLIEAAPKGVKAICCQAKETPEGVEYSYRVEPGICRVSSVKMVWERFGLARKS